MGELTGVQKYYLVTLHIVDRAIRNGNYREAIRELSRMLRELKQEKLAMDKYQ